jgi:UDP-glucose 4-epimerase
MLNRVGIVMRGLRVGRFSPEQVKLLVAGRVVDTTRLRTEAGFIPHYTTSAAFDDFAYTLVPAIDRDTVRRAEVRVAARLKLTPEPDFAADAIEFQVGKPKLVGIRGERTGPNPRRRS